MPLAVLLILSPAGAIPDCHLGREAQAWFLKQIQAFDPQMSQAIHDSSEVKPYTISDLFALAENGSPRYALRLTAFSQPLENFLSGCLLEHPPHKLRLWYGTFSVDEVVIDADKHPFTGSATYGSLIQAASRPAGSFALDFITPTAFRSDGMDIPLPLPHLLFRGCWQKWNAYAPPEVQMDAGVLEFLKTCLLIEELRDLNTTRVKFADGKRGGATGFTGRVGLHLASGEKTFKKEEWIAYAQMARALALFSFYCGIGHHATVGLGQTYPHFSPAMD